MHMKALMAQGCPLAHPNRNKLFHIYTDTSSKQMGTYIVHDEKPVAFWSCKLNNTQLKNINGKNDLLSIVMVLTEFHTVLSGAVLYMTISTLP